MKKLLCLFLVVFFATDGFSRIRTKEVDPIKGEIKIKNVAGFAYDYNNFQLVINNNVFNLSNQNIASGNLNAGVDEIIVITNLVIPLVASISLWYPNSLGAPGSNPNLVDFMQFGAAGNPYEASADSAGLWTIGDFISGNPPYTHTGGSNDEGATFWQSSTVNIDELLVQSTLSAYPNPAVNTVNISISPDVMSQNLNLVLLDLQGKVLIKRPAQEALTVLPVSHLPEGIYFAILRNKEAIIERQRVVVK